MSNHRAPLGEAGAHLEVLREAVAQSVQTFGDLLSGMTRQVLRADVDLDAGNDARIGEDLDERRAIFRLLADRLVIEDRAADALAQARRGHDQFPIGAPGLLGLRNAQLANRLLQVGLLSSIASRPLPPATNVRAVSTTAHSCGPAPRPVADFRQVLAVLVDVMLVLDQLVLDHLLQIVPLAAQMRQAIHHVLHQMEPVQIVLHPHVEGRGDGALFLVAPDMEVAVGAAVGQPMNQPGIAMKGKDDVLVLGEQRVVIRVAQPVRMLELDCSRMRSTTLMTRIFSSGRCWRRMETAARTSSVGVSPQHAITTSGSLP